MLIGMKHIQNLFENTENLLSEQQPASCLTGYTLLQSAPVPYTDYLLYVCSDLNILRYITPAANMHLLYLAHEDDNLEHLLSHISSNINILMVKVNSINDALLQLQDFFYCQNCSGLFADALMDMLFFEDGIQAIVDYAYQIFQNSIAVFDVDFRLLATNWEPGMQIESGRSILENGGFSEREYEIINREHIHNKVRKSEVPVQFYSKEFGFDQMICTIDTKKDMGHIVLSATNRPFRNTDFSLLILLKKALNQQMKKDEFIRNNKGFPYEYFLRDLLDGKIATKQQFFERLNYANCAFSGNLYCLVIETARSSSILNTSHIRILFESTFPNTKTLMYNGEIIVILSFSDSKRLSEDDFLAANNICQKQGLYAGLSNCFRNIVDIVDFYKQALRAIELGICSHNSPALFRYSDYYLEHITNIFAQKENLDTFCHPDLKILLEYDKENNSQLTYILYMYLINERNLVATASALQLHRNSLQNRIKKINSLVSINYDNHQERQYFILSYELYKAGK